MIDIEALKRAKYLLEITREFIKANNYEEGTHFWDETRCDGYCLVDDCEYAAEHLGDQIAKLEAEGK